MAYVIIFIIYLFFICFLFMLSICKIGGVIDNYVNSHIIAKRITQ